MPTDLRVGQTQAITVARTEPPSTTRPAPGQAALPRIQPPSEISTAQMDLVSAFPFKGIIFRLLAFQPACAFNIPLFGTAQGRL